MSLQQLSLLAVLAMIGLASMRVVRVQDGRTPQPERSNLFLAAFVILPPVLVGALLHPATPLAGIGSIPLFAGLLAVLALVMAALAYVVRYVARGRTLALLIVALIASEGNPDDVPFDPPLTPELATSVTLVGQANGAFPRGSEFPRQVDRDGFRGAWDALASAVSTLDGQIAEDHRRGLPVASTARAVATDAHSRLETLRRLAAERGQAWARTELGSAA